MAKKGVAVAVVVGIAFVGIIGWRWSQKAAASQALKQGQAARANAPASVEVAEAKPRRIVDVISVVGSVESPYDVKISPKISGVLDSVNVRAGDEVKVGQVLATLDPSSLTGALLEAKANLAQAKSKLAQTQIAFNPAKVGIASAIRQEKAGLASAEADAVQTKAASAAQTAAAQAQVADANAKVAQAEAALQAAQAQAVSAEANNADAQAKLNRTISLYKQAYIAAQSVDDAKAAAAAAESAAAAAKSNVNSARSGVTSAKALLDAAKKNMAVTVASGTSNQAAANAKLTQSQASLSAAQANVAQNPAYQQNIDALQAAVAAAQAQVVQAQENLSETQLVSPIDGKVTSRSQDPGSLGSPGQPVVEVQYLKWVFVTAYIPIDRSAEVHKGQLANITVDGFPGRTFTGTLSDISPAADSTSRQFLVRIKLQNPDELLKPGMFGNVSIPIQTVDAPVTVPREAVTIGQTGAASVTVVDSSSTAHVVPVKLGAQDAAGYQILSGVSSGDNVVILTFNPVKDGKKVKISSASPEVTGAGSQASGSEGQS